MKTMRATRASAETKNNIFNGPVGNAFINSSVVQTTNNTVITEQIIREIDLLSEGHLGLQSAALEVRDAQVQRRTNVADKLQKWATLANTIGGLAEKIRQYYPHLAAVIGHFKDVKP
jgi:hypothetical protein